MLLIVEHVFDRSAEIGGPVVADWHEEEDEEAEIERRRKRREAIKAKIARKAQQQAADDNSPAPSSLAQSEDSPALTKVPSPVSINLAKNWWTQELRGAREPSTSSPSASGNDSETELLEKAAKLVSGGLHRHSQSREVSVDRSARLPIKTPSSERAGTGRRAPLTSSSPRRTS